MVTVGDGVGATTIGNLETLIVTVVPFSVTASAAGLEILKWDMMLVLIFV